MRRYVVQRLLSVIPVLLSMVTLVFVVLRALPGEPTAVLVAQAGGGGEDTARLRTEYGLDRPLVVQYARYLLQLATGNLGRSLFTRQRVSQIIVQQAPATLSLALVSLVISVTAGMLLGVSAALRQDTWLDSLLMVLSTAGVSVPITLSGLAGILIFSLTLRWLPATGQGTLRHLVMPATVMGLASAGSIARLVRTRLADILREDYVMVARAKGLDEWTLLLRHVLSNAMIPVVTVIGLQFGFMLGGAVATESVFARQGLGRTLVDAILYQDYPVVQGIVIVSAALYTAINLGVDLLHGYLDPRIRYE
jgi:ABC-type dipeptide/oligopeptide/nickel transport system permease component